MSEDSRESLLQEARSLVIPAEGSSAQVQSVVDGTGDEVRKILYSRSFFSIPYEIVTEPFETLTGWKSQIEHIYAVFLSGDRSLIVDVCTRGGKLRCDFKTVLKILEKEDLSDFDMQLLSIGAWVLREKSRWKGLVSSYAKILQGGLYSLSSFLEKEGNAVCLDLAVLVDVMSKMFGFTGGIYRLDESGIAHRFWKSDQGQVLDVQYAWRRAGFFRNPDDYSKYLEGAVDIPVWDRVEKEHVREVW